MRAIGCAFDKALESQSIALILEKMTFNNENERKRENERKSLAFQA